MATLGTINPAVVNDTAHAGEKVRVFPFTDVDNLDSFASGISGITRVAWDPAAPTDIVALSESAGTIGFFTAGSTSFAGNLIVWSKGY